MSATVVQHKSNNCSPGTSVAVTLDSPPTAGNVLLAFVGYFVGQTLTATGFTPEHSNSNGNAALRVYSRIVQSGDGSAWTVGSSGSDSMSVVLAEIAGSDGTPAGWTFADWSSSGGTITNTLTITSGLLALIFGSSDGGAGNGVTTLTATGYTKDEQQIPANHTGVYGHSAGTGSSQSFTTDFDGSPDPLVQVVVAIPAPGLTESGTSSHTHGATATIALGRQLTGTSAHAHGASETLDLPLPLDTPQGLGWESAGRMHGAYATIDLDDGDTAPPAQHHRVKMQWLDITGGPDVDANGQPLSGTWVATKSTDEWGRYRIRVGHKTVTFFRGAQTIVAEETFTEPFGDDTCTLVFPMIGPFEHLGAGDLDWLPGTDDDDHVPVVIQRVTPAGDHIVRFEGDISGEQDTYDGRTGQLTVRVTGIIKTLDDRVTKPRTTSDPIDAGQYLHDLVHFEIKYGWNGHGLRVEDTGIDTPERGAFGDPLCTVTMQNVLSGMQTGEGTQWTIVNDRPRGMRLVIKDRDTIHFNLWCGQPGVTHDLTRDFTHAKRAIYGEGMDHGTRYWRNTMYPNAEDDTPGYPYDPSPSLACDVNLFCPGGSLTGFKDFTDELRTRGYDLDSRDTYRSSDEDTIRDFQDDAGITVDGQVGPQTWNAAFTTGIDANFLYSYIRPLAVTPSAEPFRYNDRGGIIGDNPNYLGRTRREVKEDFGTLSKRIARRSAGRQLDVVKFAHWSGMVTLTNIDPPEMCALDIREGMNFVLHRHRNVNRRFRVAKVSVRPGMIPGSDRIVGLTTSERGDDYITLAARMTRRHDVIDMAGRTKAPRRGAHITPDFAPWEEEAGAGRLKPRAQTAGLWNVYEIPSGERGGIDHVRLVAADPCLIASAVFNWKVTADQLRSFPGLADPSAGGAGGQDPWLVNREALTVRPVYADQPWMAWATGGPGAMQGFWPNDPAPDATVTGVLDDSQFFPFHSRNGTWLWLAVWTSESTRISGDPDYGYRALFPAANT